MVTIPYSVVNVWAMMIKPFHAHVTDVSVSASRSSNNLTIRTDIISIGVV